MNLVRRKRGRFVRAVNLVPSVGLAPCARLSEWHLRKPIFEPCRHQVFNISSVTTINGLNIVLLMHRREFAITVHRHGFNSIV